MRAPSSSLERALLLLALTGCSKSPEPDAIHLDEPVFARAAHPSWQVVPDRPIAPAPPPQLRVVAQARVEDDRACPYHVLAQGFPAISSDAAQIVDVAFDTHDPYAEDSVGDYLRLIVLESDRQRVELVFDHGQERPWEDPSACTQGLARTRRTVARINRELARTSWRSLTELELHDATKIRPFSLEQEALQVEAETELLRLPVAERPIELVFTDGELLIRVRDGQEFLREAHPDWINPNPEYCSKLPVFAPLMIDRPSGAALLRFDYEDLVSCVCSDKRHFARIQLPPELLTAVESRR
jgi:hypothetical protein